MSICYYGILPFKQPVPKSICYYGARRRVPHTAEPNHQTYHRNHNVICMTKSTPKSIMKPKMHHTITIHAQSSRQ